jgi:hypothetical protein
MEDDEDHEEDDDSVLNDEASVPTRPCSRLTVSNSYFVA